jgi:hypothetical protein
MGVDESAQSATYLGPAGRVVNATHVIEAHNIYNPE